VFQPPAFLLEIEFTKVREERSIHINIPQVLVID
jgi:hypothetical protein